MTKQTGIPADDETVIVASDVPTRMSELAWSDCEEEYPDSGTIVLTRAVPAARWLAVIAAVLLAGVTAVWFGIVLYRDEKPVAKPVTEIPHPPVAAPPPPPPVAAPPEPPHAPAKYAWMSLVVSIPTRASGQPIVASGYGDSAYVATQGTLQECESAGGRNCIEAMAISNGCGAVATGIGSYSAGGGPTRAVAIANAKTNLPTATGVYGFCLWDGNGVPPSSHIPEG